MLISSLSRNWAELLVRTSTGTLRIHNGASASVSSAFAAAVESLSIGTFEQKLFFSSSTKKPPPTNKDNASSSSETAAETPTRKNDKMKMKTLLSKLDIKFGKKDKKKDGDRVKVSSISKAKTNDNKEVQIPDHLVTAVKSVAQDLGGDTKQIESELVQKLKEQTAATGSGSAKVNLSDVFAGMKIDQTNKPQREARTPQPQMTGSRAQDVRRILDDQNRYRQQGRRPQSVADDMLGQDQGRQQQPFRPRQRDQQQYQLQPRPPQSTGYIKINLFDGKPLGIFTSSKLKPDEFPAENQPKLNTWDSLYERELKLAVTHPPKNGFEEMILWTEQGKLWKFPIDNEQGEVEEAKYAFHEHVFLEPLIESWCPKKGPIRHFMHLVCIGLGKNAHLTVKEKHEYIEWYHQYFLNKSDLLKDLGAGVVAN